MISHDELQQCCEAVVPSADMAPLLQAIQALMPTQPLRLVLSRGGWHRLGGVVDRHQQRIAEQIVPWVEQCCGGDLDQLIADYADAGYIVTRVSGTTHYLTAAIGHAPEAFIQIEIEQLEEQIERPLLVEDSYPESIEELIDPIDPQRLAAQPIGPPRYQFRRLIDVATRLDEAISNRRIESLRRFLADWGASSAGEQTRLCNHWVLAMQEFHDHEGVVQLTAKPIPTYPSIPPLPLAATGGAGVAQALQHYDRQLGYPFAWYFMLLGTRGSDAALIDTVLNDHRGDYAYLPARDLARLEAWSLRPYSV